MSKIHFLAIASFLVTLSFFLYMVPYKYYDRARKNNPKYNITTILQTGGEREALQSIYLQELLCLSKDAPQNLHALDVKSAQRKLLACPFIKKATIQKKFPHSIYVDYIVRKPVAWVQDCKNLGLDEEGMIFPIAPFFTAKRLPEVYFGFSEYEAASFQWGGFQKDRRMLLCLELLKILQSLMQNHNFFVKKMDVSKAYMASYGKQEIVLELVEEVKLLDETKSAFFPLILRLHTSNYHKQLGNYFSLKENMIKDYKRQMDFRQVETGVLQFVQKIIDLRVDGVAYVKD